MYTSTVTYEDKPDTINFGVNTDHLGNVRAVVSDIRQPVDNDGDGETDEYQADVKFYADYYPYGMLQPGRSFNAGDYRFGFQGQEKDDEITGVTGSHLSFKYRIYDSRTGRFYSVDPIAREFPHNSPYAFSENSPIAFVEWEGLEKVVFYGKTDMTVDISNIDDEEVVKELFEGLGFRYDKSWFDKNADDEYWTVANRTDYWGNPTGTYISKYASEASYKEGYGKPYYKDADRNFVQWLAAKDETLEGRGGVKEGLKLMAYTAGAILSGGGLVLGEATVGAITLFAVNSAVTLDDISAIGDEDTFLEEVARDLGGDKAVKGLQVSKITLGVFNATKGTIDIAIDLQKGNTVKATYDAVNKVWTQTNVIVSAAQSGEDE